MTRTLVPIISAVLVALFVYTAVSKLLDLDSFRENLYNQPFPLWVGGLLAWLIPSAELLTVVLLVTPPLRIWGFLAAFSLMLAFTIYVALVYGNAFGRVPCSCGGVIESMSWGAHLLFNVVFTIISFAGLTLEHRHWLQLHQPEKISSRRPV